MNDYPPPPPLSDFSMESDRLASVGQRALAWLLDGLILFIPTMLISLSFSGRAFIDISEDAGSEQLWITLLFLTLQLVYNTAFIATTRGSR